MASPDDLHLIDQTALINEANSLPALPMSAVRLASLVSGHNYDVRDVTDIIRLDPALTLKLLRCANSAAVRGSTAVTTAGDAVMRLGSTQVVALAVAGFARSFMQSAVPEYHLVEGDLWRHSVITALMVEQLAPHCGVSIPPEAFTAALLHDIGKMVMARFLGPGLAAMVGQISEAEHISTQAAEHELLDADHAELGGIIAQHWQLPESIVQAIICHHTPERGENVACDIVCLANQAAHVVEARLKGETLEPVIDEKVCERLGFKAQIGEVCEAALPKVNETLALYNAA